MPRLAIAMLYHEGNSFSPVVEGRAAFKTWAAGEAEARAIFADTASEIGGALEFLDARPDWQGVFLRMASAGAAGPIGAAAFALGADDILAGLEAARGDFDAVYLVLHGAMVAADEPSADIAFVRRVRAALGPDIPLLASFDLHANMDPAMAGLLDFAAGYKTHPHVDARETTLRVLEGLARMLETGARPHGAVAKLDAILPSINMRTDDGPMAALEALARAAEAGPDHVWDATIYGGFSYGDSPAAGASVMVYAGSAAAATETATALRDAMRARRDEFFLTLPGPAEGVAQALASPAFPVAITDSGDNPGSGGQGDTTGLLRALLAARPALPVVFAFFTDPDLVARAQAAGVGGAIAGTLGGRIDPGYGAPVPFHGRVERLTDGCYRSPGPVMQGALIDFGPTALLALDGMPVRVIVTSHTRPPSDLGLLNIHGIALEDIAIYCVKAKNHFRAAFAPLLHAIIDVDAPGPAALDLRGFTFRHVPEGLYPLAG